MTVQLKYEIKIESVSGLYGDDIMARERAQAERVGGQRACGLQLHLPSAARHRARCDRHRGPHPRCRLAEWKSPAPPLPPAVPASRLPSAATHHAPSLPDGPGPARYDAVIILPILFLCSRLAVAPQICLPRSTRLLPADLAQQPACRPRQKRLAAAHHCR